MERKIVIAALFTLVVMLIITQLQYGWDWMFPAMLLLSIGLLTWTKLRNRGYNESDNSNS